MSDKCLHIIFGTRRLWFPRGYRKVGSATRRTDVGSSRQLPRNFRTATRLFVAWQLRLGSEPQSSSVRGAANNGPNLRSQFAMTSVHSRMNLRFEFQRVLVPGALLLLLVAQRRNPFRDFAEAHVVLDIRLPKLNGIEAARQIRLVSPDSKLMFLTGNHDPEVAREALATGATGYVAKTDAAVELLNAVEAVLPGKQFVSKRLAGRGLTGDP